MKRWMHVMLAATWLAGAACEPPPPTSVDPVGADSDSPDPRGGDDGTAADPRGVDPRGDDPRGDGSDPNVVEDGSLEDQLPTLAPMALDDVRLSDDGRHLVGRTSAAHGHCLHVADLVAGTSTTWNDDELCGLRAAVPGADGHVLALTADGLTVLEVDLSDGTDRVLREDSAALDTLAVAPGGEFVAVANTPVDADEIVATEGDTEALETRRLRLVDVAGANSEDFTTAFSVRDLDFVAGRLVVTMSWWDKFGLPNVRLQLFELSDQSFAGEVSFPNCADDLKPQPDGGNLAVLAPRNCALHDIILAQPEVVEEDWSEWDEWNDEDWEDDEWDEGDPISIVDVSTAQHLGNLPGFGPVEWSPDGARVVGFTRQQPLMVQWNTFQTRPFGVVIVDVDDLSFRVIDTGETIPNYVFTGDAASVLVSGTRDGALWTARVDASDGTVTPLAGDAVALSEAALSSDGATVYALHEGALHAITAGADTIVRHSLDALADRLHVRPQGDSIVLTDRASATHYVVDADSHEVLVTIASPQN